MELAPGLQVGPEGDRHEDLSCACQPSARSALVLRWGAALVVSTLAHSVPCSDFRAWLYDIQYVFNYP